MVEGQSKTYVKIANRTVDKLNLAGIKHFVKNGDGVLITVSLLQAIPSLRTTRSHWPALIIHPHAGRRRNLRFYHPKTCQRQKGKNPTQKCILPVCTGDLQRGNSVRIYFS
jgi:hypothetical protein